MTHCLKATIVFNRRVAEQTYLLALDCPEPAADARPGQFVMLRVHNGLEPLLRRPFSVCGINGPQVLLLYRVVGRGTKLLATLPPGKRLSLLGPLGRSFLLPPETSCALLVAGGIGLAPLLFLASALDPGRTTFIAGFRRAAEIPYLDSPLVLPAASLLATEDGKTGRQGMVTEILKEMLQPSSADERVIFACGPLAMLKQVASLAAGFAIPCQVSLEAPMACGVGACQGCALPAAGGDHFLRACSEGPVFEAQQLNWEKL